MPLIIGAVAVVVVVLVAVFVGVLGAVIPGTEPDTNLCQTTPGHLARTDIPAAYLALYVKAGTEYGIRWNMLAAVGAAESDHGRGPDPGITSGANQAGASGPMQFLPGTWKAFGVDGNGDRRTNVHDPADAITAAARYLKHLGAPQHLKRALYGYNHANWYVDKVTRQATEYARDTDTSACAKSAVAASGKAGLAVRAAMRWLGTPYSWGGGGLNGPSRGFGRGANTVGFDCSGLTRHAWHQAGVSIPRTSQQQWRTLPHIPAGQHAPGDLVFFEGSGGTRTTPGHVGVVTAPGRMIEAPRTGLNVRTSKIGDRSDLVGYARPIHR